MGAKNEPPQVMPATDAWPACEIRELTIVAAAWGANVAESLRWAERGNRRNYIHQAEDFARKAWRCAVDAETLTEMANG